MTRRARWALWVALVLAAVTGALGLALAWLVPSDVELAAHITAQAEAKLGVKVTLGAVHWQFWSAALVIENAATVQPQPISFKRLVAQPRIRELFQRRLIFENVLIDGGVMPQTSLGGLRVQAAAESAAAPAPIDGMLRFRDLTWITRHGTPLEFDGHVLFDDGWTPRQAELVRPGVQPPTKMTLARDGQADRWQVQVLLGGGTAHGQVRLRSRDDGMMDLAGELEPRQVEVASALGAFKRNSAVRGNASGRTLLSASGKGLAELARSLHTQTTFSMAPATLLHIDVDKAIRSAGQDRAGQTALQSLTGRMDTQNTPAGMVVRYSAIQARGESFSASGEGTIANRRIDAELKVDLVAGLIGVPLKVTGPLAAPQVSVPTSALAGAAAGAVVGTVLLPGIGTALGASVGAAVGKMFGGEPRKDR